jgi:crotonobetainyl-CoA:carnitine CoA-transferase CaiB-like acyl-CoA transferase
MLREIISQQPRDHWLTGLATLGVPCSPINRVDQVFEDPQVKARGMEIEMPHPLAPNPIHLIGSPMKFSETPVDYRYAPPTLGQHTDEVLKEWLGLDPEAISKLRSDGIV